MLYRILLCRQIYTNALLLTLFILLLGVVVVVACITRVPAHGMRHNAFP